MENELVINRLSHMFSLLGEPSRLLIVSLLLKGPINVGMIAKNLDMQQSAVSHQLRLLKDADILKAEKQGKKIVYSINDEHVKTIVESGMIHMMH